ncbi:MAG: tetratricopeptide repeat protein [Sporolactobacillus sp.]
MHEIKRVEADMSLERGERMAINKIERAEAWLSAGQTDKGLALLRALAANGEDSEQYAAATLFQHYGFLDEAEGIYRMLLRHYPDESDLLLQLSDLLIDQDREDEAILLLQHIDENDTNYLSAQVLLADLYQLEGLDEAAEHRLLHAQQLSPNQPLLLEALGELYLATGQALKAVQAFESIRSNRDIELRLAEAYSLSGAFEQAFEAYSRGLGKEKTLDGLFGYAMTAVRLKKDDVAVQVLEELRGRDPGYSSLYAPLSAAYERCGDQVRALQTVEAGLREDAFNGRLYQEAAHLSLDMHQNDKAAYYLQKWLSIDPENEQALLHLVELLMQQEDYSSVIKRLAQQQTDDPMLQWFLASAYNHTDALADAEACYALCAPAWQSNPEFLREYGEFKRDCGKTAEAVQLFERALALDPENDELATFIERIRQDDLS